MKINTGDQFKCVNINTLDPYYDSKYNGEILTVTHVKIPKIVNYGGSCYFAIFTTNSKTKSGEENRFSVSLDKITKKNFIRINKIN